MASINKKRETIIVLDFGGQYAHLISKVIRNIGVYSEIIDPKKQENLKEFLENSTNNIKGIILSGGPKSVYENNAIMINKNILEKGIPLLGLCYGHQLIAHMANGKIGPAEKKEFGETEIIIDKQSKILNSIDKHTKVWMNHGDSILKLPNNYESIAHSANTPIAAFKHKKLPIYGMQWHPEVSHTKQGTKMISNFVLGICKCKRNWKINKFVQAAIMQIKNRVKESRCIVALSGGIDSSVATALVGKAISKNLTAVYVDTGLMRTGETEDIYAAFSDFGINLKIVYAGTRFFTALKGIKSPEQKRKIMGMEFIKIFEEEAKKEKADYLVQGTIYPDRVESGMAGNAAVIKRHHNVGGLPKKIKFKGIIEPLEDLYKDDVKKIAKELKLPEKIINRQPFPGPGLAVRIIGEVTPKKVAILQKADLIVREEIENAGIANKLWQYFAVLSDTYAVGIKGDNRAYGQVIAFRALNSRDAMTAKFAELPWSVIRRISIRITNEVNEITRVVYDTTDKPPGTIEWE